MFTVYIIEIGLNGQLLLTWKIRFTCRQKEYKMQLIRSSKDFVLLNNVLAFNLPTFVKRRKITGWLLWNRNPVLKMTIVWDFLPIMEIFY